jgi:hypothetical protein
MITFARLAFITLILCSSQITAAETLVRDMVVHTTKTALDVKLDATTVSCSDGDLKVTAPKLAALTLMNHNDFTLAAPALSAGACEPGRMPQDIIDPAVPFEMVELVVKAVRQDRVNTMTQSCTTYLVERVETTVRGVVFSKEASSWLGTRPIAQCNGADSPADDPGQVEPSTNSCAASRGGSTWLGLLLALGLARRFDMARTLARARSRRASSPLARSVSSCVVAASARSRRASSRLAPARDGAAHASNAIGSAQLWRHVIAQRSSRRIFGGSTARIIIPPGTAVPSSQIMPPFLRSIASPWRGSPNASHATSSDSHGS